MYSSNAEDLLKIYETLKVDRDQMYSIWEDCRKYYNSEKQLMQPNNSGSKITEQTTPLNPVGYDATMRFASGLWSNTFDAGQQFFTFKVSESQLGQDEDAMKDWSINAGKIAMDRLTSSNFSTNGYSMIENYVRLCTGVLYYEYEPDKGIVFKEIPIPDCCINESFNGTVDTVVREYKYSARQAYSKWGEDCHQTVKDMVADPQKANTKLTYLHFVMPRESYKKGSKNKLDLPYKSCYVNKEYKHLVYEGGYSYFPYVTPRFLYNVQMAYGRGQAFAGLDTMRAITKMCENIDDGVELKTNPPVFFIGNIEEEDIDLEPGGTNHLSEGSQVIHYQADIDLVAADAREQRKEEEIRRLFFNDIFVTIEGEAAMKNVTATAVDFIRAERIQALLPIVNRLYDEFYSPLLKGVLQILVENGEIEQPPGINIKNLRVEYNTKLDQRLKLQDSQQILHAIMEVQQVIMQMSEAPGLSHLINFDEVARDLFRNKNIPPKYIKNEDETEESRQAEADAQQQMIQQQQMMDHIGQADPMKKAEEGSLMDQLQG